MSIFNFERLILSEILIRTLTIINDYCKSKKITCNVVGGLVRDLLLGIEINDIDVDLAVSHDRIGLVKVLSSESLKVANHDKFLVSSVTLATDIRIDIVQFRGEIYIYPGSLPEVFSSDYRTDIERRDFTINTLSIELNDFLNWYNRKNDNLFDLIKDPLGGIPHLIDRKIEIIHSKSLYDDPTRIIRAAKYQAKINGFCGNLLRDALVNASKLNYFNFITIERLVNELYKLVESDSAIKGMEILNSYQCLNNDLRLGKQGIFSKVVGVYHILTIDEIKTYGSSLLAPIFLWFNKEFDSRFAGALKINQKKLDKFSTAYKNLSNDLDPRKLVDTIVAIITDYDNK
jgi:tRNA nucleotidyltransferase/poly(A) polymerase